MNSKEAKRKARAEERGQAPIRITDVILALMLSASLVVVTARTGRESHDQHSLWPAHAGKVRESGGFTLIEMSIVLVIIGLIVGGVLVGQSLINAAAVRAQITQFEKYNAAVNTFRGKYDCLPGDCVNATTFFPQLSGGYYTNGNGNGIIDDYDNNTPDATGFPASVDWEPTTFWVHLWEAGLTDCCNPATAGANNNLQYVRGLAFPLDKVNGNSIGVNNLGGRNGYFWGINQNSLTCCPNGANPGDYVNLSNPIAGVITPAQAQAFDSKTDDGGDSGEAERLFRKEAERHSGMIPNTIGA